MGGQAVSFSITQAVNSGSFAVSGQGVTFRLTTVMVVDEGSFAFTGQDVSFRISMAAAQGEIQASGQAGSFQISQAVVAGSFSLSGQDVQTVLSLIAGFGSFTVTGQDATLSPVDTPPAFDVNFILAFTKQDDQGLYMLADDLGLQISNSDLDRLNMQLSDLGWKVVQTSVRLNVKGE